MNITFLSVNSSYSHTSMAYHLLKGYADGDEENNWQLVECSIKEKVERVLRQLERTQPDWLLASVYIFSRTELFEILRRFILIKPDTKVILGGPEMLGNNEDLLREYPWISLIVRGEGEIPFKQVLEGRKWGHIKGLCWIDEENRYRDNMTAELADMGELVNHYSRLFDEKRPFVQYETSRGCPNRCTFCTSSLDPVLRYIPLEDVRKHLKVVQKAGIKEVRILDRTFNSKNSRACDLLRMFREEFPDIRFHCEVDPAFIQDSFFEELEKAIPGQMHLETGLQTFSQETYDIVKRISPIDKTEEGLIRLCSMKNVEVHADLIGGLPGCTLETQYADLMRLIKMKPHEIQLENLKVLPGTPLEKVEELVHSPTPPYEVLSTGSMNYDELCQVSNWSVMLDWFYNYHPLKSIIIDCSNYDYDFFFNFQKYLDKKDAFANRLSAQKRFALLKDYLIFIDDKESLWKLAAAWFVCGFSPEHGLFPASIFKGENPTDLVFISGHEAETYHRRYVYEFNDKLMYVFYGRGCINASGTAISVWELSASPVS